MNCFSKAPFIIICFLTFIFVDCTAVLAVESDVMVCKITKNDNIRNVSFHSSSGRAKSTLASVLATINMKPIDRGMDDNNKASISAWFNSQMAASVGEYAREMNVPFNESGNSDFRFVISWEASRNLQIGSPTNLTLFGNLYRTGSNEILWHAVTTSWTYSNDVSDHLSLMDSEIRNLIDLLYGWRGPLADPSGFVGLDTVTARGFSPNAKGKGYLYLITPKEVSVRSTVRIDDKTFQLNSEQYAAIEMPEGSYSMTVDPDNIKQTVNIKSGENLFYEIRPRQGPKLISFRTSVKMMDPMAGKIAVAKTSNTFYPENFSKGASETAITTFQSGDKTYELSRIRNLEGHSGDIRVVACSPDDSVLATGGEDKLVILWDMKTGQELKRLSGLKEEISALAFSPDGKLLASGGRDERVILHDVATGRETASFKVGDDVNALAFSPNGKLIATATSSSVVSLWDAATGKKLQKLKGHSDDVKSLSFSNDGKLLTTGGKDKRVIIWDLATGKELKRLEGHSEEITSVVFSGDGTLVASGDEEKLIYIWDVMAGKTISVLGGHANDIAALGVIDSGNVLVSADKKCNIRYWDFKTGKLLGVDPNYCSITNISLTPGNTFMAMAREKLATIMQIKRVMKKQKALVESRSNSSS